MRLSLLIVLLISSFPVFAQKSNSVSIFDTLYHQDEIHITLTYPFDSLYKTQIEDVEALISIETASGILLDASPITLNLRGKFRRMKCTMPPLMLNFKKSALKALNLSSVDEMKLVTHCIAGPEGRNNLEEERLIYQVYETLTPISYRTIWTKVTYCDVNKKYDCIVSVGFLLEPDKVLSKRLDMEERKLYNIAEDSVDFASYSNTVAYNFLIGNRDWSIVSSRNAKLFYDHQMRKYVVIPYDFDYSNIVGASYRREILSKSMKHPYDRIYEGEYFKPQAGEILKTFYGFEQTIINAVNNSINPIDAERRKRICKYFDNWFVLVKRNKPRDLEFGAVFEYAGGL